MVDAVLFDLDGTLVDTAPDLALALNQQRQMHGLPEMPFELIRPYASHGSAGLLQIGFAISPDHPAFEELRREYLQIFEDNGNPHSTLFEGMVELLDELETRAIPWGIVTNKPARFTDPLLAQLGLNYRAASVISGDSCTHTKPHPEPILAACREMRVLPSTSVYIGDAERDIAAAHACGMPAILAEYGYIGPHDQPQDWQADAYIKYPTALLDFLGY